jgi:hypothetical protein
VKLSWFILVSLLLIRDEVCWLFELTFLWLVAGLGGEDHI